MKNIAVILLSSVGLYGQWITGYYGPGGGPTGEPISAIPWNKYTHIQFWSAGAANTNDGKVCLGYVTQTDINNFLASKPSGKKALITIADQTAGARGSDGVTCGDGNTWVANTAPSTVGAFAQNIVNFVNQVGQNNGGFDGVDLDWEGYLTTANYTQYVDLITRLRAAMPTKVINMYAFPGAPTATAAAAQSSLDQVNIGCYDAGNFATWSWYNGPLYGAVVNNGASCNEAMFQVGRDNGAVAAGIARSKIGVGIPFYGYRWSGCTQAMVSGCARQNYFSYGLLVGDTTRWQPQYQHYDPTYKSNYLGIPGLNEFDAYNGVEFMGDVAAWAKSNGFGGFMTFSQYDEYVSNQTGDARYPLSTALYNAVFGAGTAPTIATSSLPAGTAGAAYSQTLTATGAAPITWSLTGSLPPGLSLNSSTGGITGTPTTAGTSSFTVQATNSAGSATSALSITINAPAGSPPLISTSTLPGGTVGAVYSQTLTATGATPITWSLASGSLPAALSLNSSTGAITGAPTASGTSNFTVQAINGAGSATKALSITINSTAPPPTSSSPYAYWKLDDGGGSTAADSSGNGKTGALFNAPSWMTGANCVVSGCLSFNGTNQYGSVALDLSNTPAVTVAFWMNWTSYANDDKLAMEFSSDFNGVTTGFMVDPNSSSNGGGQFEVGLQGDGGYNQVLFARPTPGWHHYALVFNKSDVASNEVTPYVDGVAVPYTKPTNSENTNNFGSDTLYLMSRAGSGLFGNGALDEVQVYNQALSASQILNLAALPPTITSTSLSAGTVGVAYSQTLTATGTTPITWSLSGSLPAGLSLNSSTGAVTGTPTTAGTSNFTVQASTSTGSATKALSITINAPAGTPPVITTSSLSAGTVGTAYSQTLTATGATPMTWSLSAGSLPAALSLNSSTGAITGTPTTTGTISFTVQAANAAGTATKLLSIAIGAIPQPPTTSGPYAYWKLDDGSGSTAADSSGNGQTATLFNAPSWMDGANCVASRCLSFNGANQYGAVALNLADTSAVTLSFWMKWTSYANDDRLAMEFSSDFNNVATGFMVDPNSSAGGGGQFEVGVNGDGGYNQVLFARPTPGWHHYAFVFNKGATAANEVIPYVDGVAVPYTKPTNSENTNNFGSDTLYFMSRAGSGLFGNGAMDEVQVYKTPLSASQILILATMYKPSADTQPPTVSITSPVANQNVSLNSRVTLSATASDNVGVVAVLYQLDGIPLWGSVTNAGGSFSMVWTATSRGWHTLTAVASDAAGNATTSAPVTFRVR